MEGLSALKDLLGRLTITQSETQDELYNCDLGCFDTGWIVEEGKGARRCDCLSKAQRDRQLVRIPPEYRSYDLATLQADIDRHPKQAALIEAIRENPDTSLLLSGRVGCGKSLFGWLFYKAAVEQGRPSIALPLAELLLQFRRYEMGGEQVPDITFESLRTDKRRYLVFLDEFDKARPSEFASEQLFLLIDAIYTYHHQLIVTSNLDKDALRQHWSRASEQYGISIMRRLLELDGMTRVEMF